MKGFQVVLDNTSELREIAVKALFEHGIDGFPTNLDYIEVAAIAREKSKRYAQPPMLMSVESDRIFDPKMFEKVEKKILKMLEKEPPGKTLSIVLSLFHIPNADERKRNEQSGANYVFKSKDILVEKRNYVYEITFNRPVKVRGTAFPEMPLCPEYSDYAAEKIYRDLVQLGLDITKDAHRVDISVPKSTPKWKPSRFTGLASCYPPFPVPKKTWRSTTIDSVASAMAAETMTLAKYFAPAVSFSLSRSVSNDNKYCSEEEIEALKQSPGVKIAKDVFMRLNPKWSRLKWSNVKLAPNRACTYNIYATNTNAIGNMEDFAKQLHEKLFSMGYMFEMGQSEFFDGFFFQLSWISEEDWFKYLCASCDPSAIAAWEAGVPIEDIIV